MTLTSRVLVDLSRMSPEDFRLAAMELCSRGLLTCTSGRPGDKDATYALAWRSLDKSEQFATEIRAQHEENMRQIGLTLQKKR
jgi:hypothetical protein